MPVTHTGGARLGTSHWRSAGATWPFVTLTVDPSGLNLRLLGRDCTLERSHVRRVELWSFNGLRVIHDEPSVQPYVLFRSFRRKALIRDLKDAGYIVSGRASGIDGTPNKRIQLTRTR
ncbi:MAG: hypothetical protein ACYCX5_13255 [Coriobacteriia bacterium]